MSRAFFTVAGRPRAQGFIRRDNQGNPQSVNASVPDGDTVGVQLDGSGTVRFLGIDTPEKSFEQPLGASEVLDSEEWAAYLSDPFAGGAFLDDELVAHLMPRLSATAGTNHRAHGLAAEAALQDLIEADIAAMDQDLDTFEYFLSFSYEVFDSYGRLLAFVNRNQPNAGDPGPRPRSYNERMLEVGMALPYFIWPNIDPFRDAGTILDAVIPPGQANALAQERGALQDARDKVIAARANGLGVFYANDPLRFEAFEIRYLGRRRPPSRPVIDLGSSGNVILRPQSYFKIAHAEDRLFLPPEFLPAFVARGWRLEGW